MAKFREMKSPIALAACGAFLVPEPLGTCFVLVAVIWWLCRKIGSPCLVLLSFWVRTVRRYFIKNSGMNRLHCGNDRDMLQGISDGSVDPNGFSLHDEHKTETVIGVNRPFDMIVARNSWPASTTQLGIGLAGNTAAETFSSYPTKT